MESFFDLEHAKNELDSAVRAAVRGLNRASSNAAAEDDLVRAYEEMDLQVARATLLLPRPDRNESQVLLDSAVGMKTAFDVWLSALAAPTMIDAQQLGAQAQKMYFEAEVAAMTGTSPGDGAAYDDAAGLVEVDRRLAEQHRQWSLGDDPGAGLLASLLLETAQALFDEKRVRALVQEARRVPDHEALRQLVESPTWRSGEQSANEVLVGAGQGVLLRVEDPTGTDRDIADSALKLVADMRDTVARHSLATMLACAGHGEYAQIRRQDAGKTLKRSTKLFPALELDTLARVLRNSGAHASVVVRDGMVILDSHRDPVAFTETEFLDAVLKYIETLWAVETGIMLAVRDAGGDADLVALMEARQRAATIEAILQAGGCGESQVSITTEEATAAVTTIPEAATTLAVTITPLLPESVETLTLKTTDEGCRYEVKLHAIRQFQDAPDVDHEVTVWAVRAAERLNGQPTRSAEEWRDLIWRFLSDTEGQSPRDRAVHLRRLKPTLDASGHPELDASFREAMSAARATTRAEHLLPPAFGGPAATGRRN